MADLQAIYFGTSNIFDIKYWLEHGGFPEEITTPEQQRHYAETFKSFREHNDKLYYENRVVVPEDDPTAQRDAIQEAYDTPEALGKGINLFFAYIETLYLGVRRKTVTAFLKAQVNYQLAASHPRVASRGLSVTTPFQVWAIDLIDLNPYVGVNRGYRYILSVLDMFSRFAWLVGIKHKLATNVTQGIQAVYTNTGHRFNTPERQVKLPGALYSDFGSEFKGELTEFCRANGISQIHNSPYVPVADIENLNREVRLLLRANFIKQRSLNWCDHINEIALSLNSNYKVKLKASPLQIMTDYFNRDDELINAAAERRRAATASKFEKYSNQDNLQEGDHVRVELAAMYSNLRARKKAGTAKLNIVLYSPTVYRIAKRYPPPPNRLGYASYSVVDRDDRYLVKPSGQPFRFRFTQLQHVPTGLTVPTQMTQALADRLNKVDKASLDLVEQPVDPPVEKVEKIKVESAPKAAVEWKSPDWTELLKGKVVASQDRRYLTLDVTYDRSKKRYDVKSVDFDETENGKPIKGARRIHTDLAYVLFCCRDEAWFTAELGEYYKTRLTEADMNVPAVPVSGGRLVLVCGRFLRMRHF